MGWRERVLQRIDECGFKTRNDLCHKAGLSAGSLNMALAGSHDLKMATLEKLAVALDTTSKWILFGDEVVEAIRVPLLTSGTSIAQHLHWIESKDASDSTALVEIGGGMRVSKQAFAWRHLSDDMAPVFQRGDILIVEPVKEITRHKTDFPKYVLAVYATSSRLSVTKDPVRQYKTAFLRRLSYVAGKPMFESTCPEYYSSIPWEEPGNSVGTTSEGVYLVGVVVQRITIFYQPEILP